MKTAFITYFGAILFCLGIISAVIYAFSYWYNFSIIGIFLVFGSLNNKTKVNSLFTKIQKSKTKDLLIIILTLISIGFIIDQIGSNLDLWIYPKFNLFGMIVHVWLIGYPFTFLAMNEMYHFMKSYLPHRPFLHPLILLIITSTIGSIILELLNVFAKEWIYQNIPFQNITFLEIPVVVILLWNFLTLSGLFIEKI